MSAVKLSGPNSWRWKKNQMTLLAWTTEAGSSCSKQRNAADYKQNCPEYVCTIGLAESLVLTEPEFCPQLLSNVPRGTESLLAFCGFTLASNKIPDNSNKSLNFYRVCYIFKPSRFKMHWSELLNWILQTFSHPSEAERDAIKNAARLTLTYGRNSLVDFCEIVGITPTSQETCYVNKLTLH